MKMCNITNCRIKLLWLAMWLTPLVAWAQTPWQLTGELMQWQDYTHARRVINHWKTTATPQAADSLAYLQAVCDFYEGHYHQAQPVLQQFSRSGPWVQESLILLVAMHWHQKEPAAADSLLRYITLPDSVLWPMKAAVAILQQQPVKAVCAHDSLKAETTQWSLSQDITSWQQDYKRLAHKRPWLAAGLSALIPGAGKWYAGQLFSGLAATVTLAGMGALVAEWALLAGVLHGGTLALAVPTLIFYAGNVAGSRAGITAQKTQLTHEIYSIMADYWAAYLPFGSAGSNPATRR